MSSTLLARAWENLANNLNSLVRRLGTNVGVFSHLPARPWLARSSPVTAPNGSRPHGSLPPDWWCRGLALRERLPCPGSEVAEAAGERVVAWREAHGLGAATRLAALGVDEATIVRLYAESPESLAARTVRPAWAEFVERAVAAATVSEWVGAGWRTAFAAPFRSFVSLACEAVAARAGALPIALDSVLATLADELADRLAGLAARTLVYALHRERVAGRLTGDTPAARFADFVRQLSAPDRLAVLFAEFPVLGRLLGQACEQAVAATTELLERFAQDRDAIADELCGGELGALHRIDGAGGDAHQGGRSVRMLRFADGRTIVYKPRSLAMHERFAELISWLNHRLPGLGLRTVRAVVRPGYGWTEYVTTQSCDTLAEVTRFYRRQGALLALLYAVEGTDMHCENVIACGDQPVVVDTETILHPYLHDDADPAARALSRSVHRTALLPQLFLGEHGAFDISGLGGDRGAPYPTDGVRWADAGTDRMRLVRGPSEFPGSDNRPRLAGRETEPADHAPALIAGFRAAYRAIASGRRELTGLLADAAGESVRVLVRPTRLYAGLLDESTHPSLLRDALDRDRMFDLLWVDGEPGSVTGAEITDLWAGDVPLFTTRPGSQAVWDSRGERTAGVLTTSGRQAALNKLATMDEVDRTDQEWLIAATLATRPRPVEHRGLDTTPNAPHLPPTRERLLAAACGVADRLVATAKRAHGRANWLGLELVDGRFWQVLPMGAGLGEGYCGVALFLGELARHTGLARYRDLAASALGSVPALITTLTEDPALPAAAGCGGPLGLGGVAYALARLMPLLDDQPIADWLVRLVSVLPAGEKDTPRGFDVGLAGGLAAMQAVHELTGLPAAGHLAEGYAELLTEPAPPDARPGFARGETGVGWALRRFAASGGDPSYATAGQSVLAATPPADGDLGWCGGTAGEVLARATDDGVDRLIARGPLRDMSLCHGELGVLEALGAARADAALARRTGQLLAAIERSGPRCGTPDAVPAPNLLMGLAGIGYGLLALGFAEETPSALLMKSTC